MEERLFSSIPNLGHEEFIVLKNVTNELDDTQIGTFISLYNSKRKTPDIILITCLIGLLGVAGIHRFLIGQTGMGVLWLLTVGLCYIGTIVDAVNYKNLAQEYNQRMAFETLHMVKSFNR